MKCRKKKLLSNFWQCETQKRLLELTNKYFVDYLTKELSKVIKFHPDKECLVLDLLKNFVECLKKVLKNKVKLATYTPELARKNNWMTLKDKLTSLETPTIDTLTTLLLKISVPALISKEKDCKRFWTDAYKGVSEMLWSPTEIDYQDLGLTSSKLSLKKQEGHLPLLTIREMVPLNKNSQKTCYQSFISTHVDKWVNADMQTNQTIPPKLSWRMKLNLTQNQKTVIDKQLQVSNYVYNKTVNAINNRTGTMSKLGLRDRLVIYNSRKSDSLYCYLRRIKTKVDYIRRELRNDSKNGLKSMIKLYMFTTKWYLPFIRNFKIIESSVNPITNLNIKSFEIEVEKEIRSEACFKAYQNYNTCIGEIKTGSIKFFELKYRSKRKHGLSMTYAGSMFKIKNDKLYFTSKKLTDKQIKMNPKTLKKFKRLKLTKLPYINIHKHLNQYYLAIPIDSIAKPKSDNKRIIALDPGVRTFLTGYDPNHKSIEFHYGNRTDILDKLKFKIKQLRFDRERNRIKKRTLTRLDLKKEYNINELHYKSIHYLVNNYDLIFLEQFDSQKCVKGSKQKTNNRRINNLKPYEFRTRLLYKAGLSGKIVKVVKAYHTSKTCANCGNYQDNGSSKVYDCTQCKQVSDRDLNAAKNILLKGLLN